MSTKKYKKPVQYIERFPMEADSVETLSSRIRTYKNEKVREFHFVCKPSERNRYCYAWVGHVGILKTKP